ncbi:hypothetical protein [Actinoplanes teichomyceticus]|uniref:Uncharacterized protein n=1 Tax=Actinoplanes teichomyceticus TaxID=1867 RepID=A0A561VGH0_ACTTI|nr:hypothetical protein [Actinoplanes teichomyceticus]TWG10715.1 hypothetical protein FHX34_107211 [Actinoplanes teichomyceticus]GIF15481.1 hypothetical protein Ate01nite_55130 [Actinoplanes teichomyceticus]
MSTDVEAKYGIDMSGVRRLESLMGEPLPDILEPLRQIDADFDRITASLHEYRSIADDLNTLTAELSQTRTELAWQGAGGDSGRSALDWILLVLGWIGAIILFIVAALLMLVALLLYAIGAMLRWIGDAIAYVSAVTAVVVTVLLLIRSGGSGNTGQLAFIWAGLRAVFDKVLLAVMGLTGALGDGFGWIFEQCAKAVMWLALWLVEVGAIWTEASPEDVGKVRKERKELFGGD